MVSVSLATARDTIVQNTAPGSIERQMLIAFVEHIVSPTNHCFAPQRFSNAVEHASQQDAIQKLLTSGKV